MTGIGVVAAWPSGFRLPRAMLPDSCREVCDVDSEAFTLNLDTCPSQVVGHES